MLRPAARILELEFDAIRPLLEDMAPEAFDLPTVCTGWSVRDVLGHCSAALARVVTGDLHDFSPQANELDVEERRLWDVRSVLDELYENYPGAAIVIDNAGGLLDGIGLGEWVHGGDVRDAVGAWGAYASTGIHLAIDLLVERSIGRSARRIDVTIGGEQYAFGAGSGDRGTLETDAATFVRLCANRNPDPDRYELIGASPGDLVLFS